MCLVRHSASQERVHLSQAVPADPGICCDSTQVPGSVVGLCHHGPVRAGVLSRYVVLSCVKQLENLHLITFHEEAIKVSS